MKANHAAKSTCIYLPRQRPSGKLLHNGVISALLHTDSDNQHLQRETSRDSDKVTPPPMADSDPSAWHSTKKMIFVKPSSKNNLPTGFWPIPESFWPDPSLSKLVCSLFSKQSLQNLVM